MNSTTRRFARSTHEAFAVERAGCWSGPHRRPLGERIYGVILAVMLGISGAALLVHYLAR